MINMKEKKEIEAEIVAALQTVYDPEIPVSIFELGLIYNIDIKKNMDVDILMTLTTPNCPEAEVIPGKVADAVSELKEVGEVRVEITWEPEWNPEMMSEAARLELGMV